MIDQAEQAYKVSEITRIISGLLEPNLQQVTVEGEISNFRPASSGHWYFSLKDQDAVISAAMFRGRNSRLGFTPADGMLVRVTGSISVYAKRGSYQIIAERMQQAGTGDILAMLEERKQRLAREGIFATDRKRELPRLPQRVAVLTSPTGAAVRDILQVLQRRNAGLHVVVVPCAVQGSAAPREILRGLELIQRHDLGEVIILGRGGGSLEDLLPFSDEAVVRAIADCRIPTVSAVGHEIDWALSDYAADMRAPTPSAAAELVTENRLELYRQVLDRGRGIAAAFMQRLSSARSLIDRFEPQILQERYAAFQQPLLQRLDDAKEDLISAMQDRTRSSRQQLQLAHVSLEAMSPFAVLQRGYAIVYDDSRNEVVSRIAQAPPAGSSIGVVLADGRITASVTEAAQQEQT
ncbi:exodeoxyribonuclease VII large subunit [Spirochaeta africana]|uniref:Exodeoxyribonuclease 7 large subunit n=1 Tax=Spirochaeta africana (strain ATCC 700263 / DSM 8902 / Z-7692) TaxID=889378 RepID=H9UJP4_SPIAZ|nr:exodeoxyribonuclease VII large subunit [Spirochaeta africana]AFG37737.1 exodeoxyribonuclease VII, large subunit [Spirochaeta africana DSM 8902]